MLLHELWILKHSRRQLNGESDAAEIMIIVVSKLVVGVVFLTAVSVLTLTCITSGVQVVCLYNKKRNTEKKMLNILLCLVSVSVSATMKHIIMQ